MAAAAELNGDAALVWIDDRADYGEVRKLALAVISDLHFFIAFVDLDPAGEIMDQPKSNRREVIHAAKAIQENLSEAAHT